jgi:hypothetical protein
VAVHEKDKPRGGIQQQGDVAHIVRGAHSAFDLVDQVEYLFVRVVRARSLLAADSNGTSDPVSGLGCWQPQGLWRVSEGYMAPARLILSRV